MQFVEDYTTSERAQANPEAEKDKVSISNDAFAIGSTIANLITQIKLLRGLIK